MGHPAGDRGDRPGRVKQKQRTREALVDAARALVARGVTPTVEEAAVEAAISRTTAYRYFPKQRELLVAAYPEIDAGSLLADDAPDDVFARLDIVVERYLRMTVENEATLRAALRISLEADEVQRRELLLRRGRVIGWLEDAFEPLRGCMPERRIYRLVRAIRAAVGIESLVWLCDVGGLDRAEAVGLMKWSARALLSSALAEAGVKP